MKSITSFTLLIIVLIGGGLAFLFYVSAPQSAVSDQAMLERGKQVYSEQYCGVCHQLSSADTRGTFGPSHDHIGSTAAQRIQEAGYTGSATTPADYIKESLLQPRLYYTPGYEATNHQMPSYEQLTPDDMAALIALLISQK